MFPEAALVFFSCFKAHGCLPVSSHYYSVNPEMRGFVERKEEIQNNFFSRTTAETIGPIILLSVGGTGTVRINNSFNLQIGQKNFTLIFAKEF